MSSYIVSGKHVFKIIDSVRAENQGPVGNINTNNVIFIYGLICVIAIEYVLYLWS